MILATESLASVLQTKQTQKAFGIKQITALQQLATSFWQTALLPTLPLPIISNMPPAQYQSPPVPQSRVYTPPMQQTRAQVTRPRPAEHPHQPSP